MNLQTAIMLNDNNSIPQVGFGTWQLKGEEAYNAVAYALEQGVRHIDTATIYGNEEEVGKAIHDSDVDRNDLFITSKVWNSDQGFDSTMQACHDSLKRLGTDHLDLYLVHWPVSETRVETYKALEKLQADGFVKSIGVSNFLVEHLEELLDETNILPTVNQIEMHPFNYGQREDILDFCEENDIAIEAYSPLVQGQRFEDEVLSETAEKVGKSPAQVLLRWSVQHGFIVLFRSSKEEHIADNLDIFDFELDEREMEELNNLNENLVTTMDPASF